MDNSELIGVSNNGLEIHWVEDADGSCHVELRVPADHDPDEKAFAQIVRDARQVWSSRTRNAQSSDVLYVINQIDQEYEAQRSTYATSGRC